MISPNLFKKLKWLAYDRWWIDNAFKLTQSVEHHFSEKLISLNQSDKIELAMNKYTGPGGQNVRQQMAHRSSNRRGSQPGTTHICIIVCSMDDIHMYYMLSLQYTHNRSLYECCFCLTQAIFVPCKRSVHRTRQQIVSLYPVRSDQFVKRIFCGVIWLWNFISILFRWVDGRLLQYISLDLKDFFVIRNQKLRAYFYLISGLSTATSGVGYSMQAILNSSSATPWLTRPIYFVLIKISIEVFRAKC